MSMIGDPELLIIDNIENLERDCVKEYLEKLVYEIRHYL